MRSARDEEVEDINGDTAPTPPGFELIDAVRDQDAVRLRRLLEGGPLDPTVLAVRDADGWSALDRAAGAGSPELTEMLLEAGADPSAVGAEGRTPYEIALGAAHVRVARLLRAAEDAATGPGTAADRRWLPYCRAYPIAELRAFPGWTEAEGDEQGGSVVYVHHDLTVTRGIWVGEDVVFDQVDPEWERFCRDRLGFAVPDELDLLPDGIGGGSAP